MSTEKHSKYLYELSVMDELQVKDFAWSIMSYLYAKKPLEDVVEFLEGWREDRRLSQECWNACVDVFWRLVGVFACPHKPVEYVDVCKGIMKGPLRMFTGDRV